MEIFRNNFQRYKEAYNMMTSRLCHLPIVMTWLKIEPRHYSHAHAHYENEIFIIVQGLVECFADENKFDLSVFDMVRFTPFEKHQFYNPSYTHEVIMLSLVWENAKQAKQSSQVKSINKNYDYLITSTPPTPNGDLHIGHISGPYLRADVLTRFFKLKGYSATHLLNTDDFQSYVFHKDPNNPNATAEIYANAIRSSLAAISIEPDIFYQSSKNKAENKVILDLFNQLRTLGYIVEKKQETLFCCSCSRMLYEVYVIGFCPYCHQKTRGTLCELCGWINDCQQLNKPHCDCGQPAQLRSSLRYYFPLESFREQLLAYYSTLELEPHVTAFIEEKFSIPLPDMAVSHQSHWGIQIAKNEIISVWLEMGLRHAYQIKKWQQERENIKICHFFGFDNSFFNLILFPSIFIALDLVENLPSQLIMNPFYHLEGEKFSTSRHHVIWIKDLIQNYPIDAIRLYLCAKGPEWQVENFSEKDLSSYIHQSVSNTWRLWIEQIDSIMPSFNYKIPEVGLWLESHKNFYRKLIETDRDIETYYQRSQLRLVCQTIHKFVEYASSFLSQYLALSTQKTKYDYWRTTIALQVLTLYYFAVWLAPIMPNFAKHLATKLHINLENKHHFAWVKSVYPVRNIGDIFNGYESEQGMACSAGNAHCYIS